MITVQIEGQPNQVKPFLDDLQRHPTIELLHHEVKNKGMTGQVDVQVTCYVKHLPKHRLKVVQLVTEEGAEIHIPFLDLVNVEIEEGKKVFAGRVFDVFA
ncbi:hypothetical protein ACFO25_04665 [Paenactinomyces guangxiensis]|uniref:Uncharacterized protein n=1 Tax=Paenactinomyces guangxiensis TaxID=1490290 RepID=A0A7W2A7K6_9BACL|nr:hypothetical protein [Paenactinomyces guangxiensis]MBA4493670.1 hypothetical protein [Paenactinomyces guangxiensis]MBH8590957.1 hypothetical protein [Paenactinomyces guangxiensis]